METKFRAFVAIALILFVWILQTLETTTDIVFAYNAMTLKTKHGQMPQIVDVYNMIGKGMFGVIIFSTLFALPSWWNWTVKKTWLTKILTLALVLAQVWSHYQVGRIVVFGFCLRNLPKAGLELSFFEENDAGFIQGILQYHLVLCIIVLMLSPSINGVCEMLSKVYGNP